MILLLCGGIKFVVRKFICLTIVKIAKILLRITYNLCRISHTYGKHIVPHDAAVLEYSTGLSCVEIARNHGIHFTITPDIALIEEIDAVRDILNRCWFDEVKCVLGIKVLENYKKEWNDRHGCWSSRPLHNLASHGADAFRILVLGIGKLAVRVSAEE